MSRSLFTNALDRAVGYERRVKRGRWTARTDEEFLVYIVGMSLNRPWRVGGWAYTVAAALRMRRQLHGRPATGCLGFHLTWLMGGPAVFMYWRSYEELEAYARDPGRSHLPAWRWFNTEGRNSGDVGLWHELFRARAGEAELAYANTPRLGVLAFRDPVPIGSTQTAAQRMGLREEDSAPVEGYAAY